MQYIKIYIARLELHGVLLFASEQRPSLSEEGGAVISASQFIHNYPLIYGLLHRSAEAYAVIPSLHFMTYDELSSSKFRSALAREPLRYTSVEEQLRALVEGCRRDGGCVYSFPAYPLRVTMRKFFMAAKGSGYADFRGRLKTVYPRLVHYVAIVPPSEFSTVVLTYGIELPKTMYVRIGMKRMGLFKVTLSEAEVTSRVSELGWTTIPVNLYDLKLFGYDVVDFLKVLETRSKPPKKPDASVIGYAMCRNLFTIRPRREVGAAPRTGGSEARGEIHRIPLPLKLVDIS